MVEKKENNGHYSEQTGHYLRGVHERLKGILNGYPPESIPGYDGMEAARIRRSMRIISRTGKK